MVSVSRRRPAGATRPLVAILALAATLAGCAMTPAHSPTPPPFHGSLDRDHPLMGQIIDPVSGAAIPPSQALARITAAPLVLLGERHDNPDHHALQAFVYQAMIDGGRRPALVLEMIDDQPDQTAVLAAWMTGQPLPRPRPAAPDEDQGQDSQPATTAPPPTPNPAETPLTRDLADLGQGLAWEARGWPSFALYAPLLAAAKTAGVPILAGNLPPAQVRAIARQGADSLPEAERGALALTTPLPDALQADLEQALQAGHCHMLPDAALPPMALAQRARDGKLAQGLLRGMRDPRADGAVLIAGAGHVRADRGVPWVLHRLAAATTGPSGPSGPSGPAPSAAPDAVVSVAFVEVEPGVIDPARYAEAGRDPNGRPIFDLLWFTPRIDRPDPCEALRAHFKARRDG